MNEFAHPSGTCELQKCSNRTQARSAEYPAENPTLGGILVACALMRYVTARHGYPPLVMTTVTPPAAKPA